MLVTAAAALFCELGLWFLRASNQSVTVIWPAAGVCTGIFYRWGWRAFPWVALGHAVIWLRFPMSPALLAAPFIYSGEAWLASYLGFRLPILKKPDRSAMGRTAWKILLVPWLACFPCGAFLAWAATSTGRYPADELPLTIARISMAHVHGMIALGPLSVHLLRRDFNSMTGERGVTAFAAMTGALCLMVLTFAGFFQSMMGPGASAYLAFPFVIMTGVTCRPPFTALFLAAWCLGTSIFTSMGTGPFAAGGGSPFPLDLGIYNLIVCSTAYLVSAGSTRFVHQLRRNDLSLEAAGVELWEWDARRGLHSVSGDREQGRVRELTGNLPPLAALTFLAGSSETRAAALPDRWKHRTDAPGNPHDLLLSSGCVISRERDGSPREALGLLQDLSALRKAEEALIALGHQRAQLRSLQTRLNPHFLFNALNATRALIHLDPGRASETITTLARLLRANLRNTDRPLIPLADEMQIVTDLLAISGMRFGERLRTDISVEPAAEDALVPPMIVFNLVENAILHGIEKSTDHGTISLQAKVRDEDLFLSVGNPGRLREPLAPGVGTADAKQRLELIFGALGRFRLFQSTESTILAEIVIPFRDHESAHC